LCHFFLDPHSRPQDVGQTAGLKLLDGILADHPPVSHYAHTAKRALYYNLGQDEELALAVDMEIVGTKRDASRKKWKCVQASSFYGFCVSKS